MKNLSFHEKSAIGTLIGLLVVGFFYFESILDLWQANQLDPQAMSGLAIGLTILLIAILVTYHIVIAATSRSQPEDERDRLIAWRAGNIAGMVLGFGVIGLVGHILLGAVFDTTLATSPLLIANVLIALVLVAGVVELAATLLFYRRGV